jgi:hypothetical protein
MSVPDLDFEGEGGSLVVLRGQFGEVGAVDDDIGVRDDRAVKVDERGRSPMGSV